jgi:beta-glucosidase
VVVFLFGSIAVVAFHDPPSSPRQLVKMLLSVSLCIPLLIATAEAVRTGNDKTMVYKDGNATIDARVEDLLSRMTIDEKTSQLIQGDIRSWVNITDGSFNVSGLEWSMRHRGGSYYVGVSVGWEMLSSGIKLGQDYLTQNTTLGIPAWVQSEGIHGFRIPNATIFNSPIAYASSFNPALVEKMARAIAQEALALGVNNLFAPLADLARELRYGRVEETFGEDPYL